MRRVDVGEWTSFFHPEGETVTHKTPTTAAALLTRSVATVVDVASRFPEFRRQGGIEAEGFFLSPDDGRMKFVWPQVKPQLRKKGICGEFGNQQFEVPTQPRIVTGDCFKSWAATMRTCREDLRAAALPFGAVPVYTGIPPFLSASDLAKKNIAVGSVRAENAYAAWEVAREAWTGKYGCPPQLDGYVPQNYMLATAFASLQFNRRMPNDPNVAARWYNLELLLTPLLLAAFTATPWLVNATHCWEEIRVPQWRLDDCGRGRVFYGPGWVDSIIQVFADYARRPFIDLGALVLQADHDPLDILQRQIKDLWPFVRVRIERDHWRTENRVLASLPPEEMMLASALHYGLHHGAIQSGAFKGLKTTLPFGALVQNFDLVARSGLDAVLTWIDGRQLRAGDILLELMPILLSGLGGLGGLGLDDAQGLHDGIKDRVSRGCTPARRMRRALAELEGKGRTQDDARRDLALQLIQA